MLAGHSHSTCCALPPSCAGLSVWLWFAACRVQLDQQKKDLANAASAAVDKDAMARYVEAQIALLKAEMVKDVDVSTVVCTRGVLWCALVCA